MANFDQFQLSEPIKKAIQEMGFVYPTPIQEKAIGIGLSRRDLIGCAQTGTGKTMAFLIPMVSVLLKSPRKEALILVPTRELASQVTDELNKLLKHVPELKTAVIIGGVSMPAQVKALQKTPRIIIATPGRLVDHLRRGTASLRHVEFLVLDEADRMLDMGFAQQLTELMRFVPASRQTLLFSATLPPTIQKIASKYMKDPVRVDAGPVSKPVEKIVQETRLVTAALKKDALKEELKKRAGTVLVFARTKHRADGLCRYLVASGHSADRIHGGRSQAQRTKTIDGFRGGKFQILVATDIVARGIDISHIAHVINFDLPMNPEDYVHRIGRTARAGSTGQALSLVAPEDRDQWKRIASFVKSKDA